MEKIKDLPKHSFNRSFSKTLSPDERLMAEQTIDNIFFAPGAKSYNLDQKTIFNIKDLVAHSLFWIRDNLHLSVDKRKPSMKKIKFFSGKQWGEFERFQGLSKGNDGCISPLSRQISVANPEQKKTSFNTFNHEVIHNFSHFVTQVYRESNGQSLEPVSEALETAHTLSIGYSNNRNAVLDYFNEVITEMINIETLDAYRKEEYDKDYLTGVGIGYEDGVIFFDLLFKKMAERLKSPAKEIRYGIYKGFFEGDRKKLSVFDETFGKGSLKFIAAIRNEKDFDSLIKSRKLFEFFGVDYGAFKKMERRYSRGKEIELCDNIKIK